MHSLPFACLTAAVTPHKVERLEARAAVKPANQRRIVVCVADQKPSLAGEIGEDGLGDIMGKIR